MHIYRQPAEPKVRNLLATCNLPTVDLQAEHFKHFFGCGWEDDPKGVVGVELYGKLALLRSLAVHETVRGRGCGKRLVQEAEQYAAGLGVQSLYLLTTTAEAFFGALGYAKLERSQVPEVIQNTREFSSLCPSSSIVMVKHLAG